MATSGKGAGMVGDNVQTAVHAEHHLIVAHEVTNVGHDRSQLSSLAKSARKATAIEDLTVLSACPWTLGRRSRRACGVNS
jgi:hypothetical protein